MDESELVCCARNGDNEAFRAIMRRSNQRLFRIARSVMRDDAEAEDVVQESYLHAFAHLGDFRGEAGILTWLTRIAFNEACGRLRRRRPNVGLEAVEAAQGRGGHVLMFPAVDPALTPETLAARMQVRQLLEAAVDELPDDFRMVFVLRDIDGCSIAETGEVLGLRAETVKTRLHRARRRLRSVLSERLAATFNEAFPFMGERCERMSEAVLARMTGHDADKRTVEP